MTSSKEKNYLSFEAFIKMAANFEKEAAEFYRSMLENYTVGKSVKELLELFERQEIAHEKILLEMEVPEGGGFLQFPPDMSLSMPPPPEGEVNLDILIDLSIERERIAKEIYEKTAKQVKGKFREMVEALAVFEKEHEEKLKSLKNYY